MAEALSDEQVAAICRSEVDSASGRAAGEISHERAEALDYYYGDRDWETIPVVLYSIGCQS